MRCNILVVDDCLFQLKAVSRLLYSIFPRQIFVDCALSGKDALGMVASRKYDYVILDLLMPGMDGMETAKRIRELDKEAYILAHTAISHDLFLGLRLEEHGIDSIVSKPIDAEFTRRFFKVVKGGETEPPAK